MSDLNPLAETLRGLDPEWLPRRPFMAGRKTVTYSEFRDQVQRTRGLFRRHGLEPGDRIAVASEDDLAVAALIAAAILDGCTIVALDPGASASEATVLLNKARVRAVAADKAFIERAEVLRRADGPATIAIGPVEKRGRTAFGLLLRRPSAGENYPNCLSGETPVADARTVSDDMPALILFTSGTTSQPKGVTLTRRNLAAQLRAFHRQLHFDADCRVLNPLPLHHTDGICLGLLVAMTSGGTWVRPDPIGVQTLGPMLDLIQREKVTHLVAVPTIFAMMKGLPEEYDDAFHHAGFRFAVSTAGYLDEALWRGIEERFAILVVNCYGLTETVSEALYCGPDETTRFIGTVGKPVGFLAKIVDDAGDEVPYGQSGELLLSGEQVMLGYFEDPDATSQVLQGNWLRTGDLATRCADGFYRIVGRKKEVIIRGGVNVYPADVNSILLKMPGVSAVCTIGLPDELLGEKVVACIVPTNPAHPPEVPDIMAHCRKLASEERVPNAIVFVTSLPYGPSGKVELPKLREETLRVIGEGDRCFGNGSVEDVIRQMAADAFGLARYDLDMSADEGSTPGWNSLSFLELIMSVERRFGIRLDARDVMNVKRLQDLATATRRKQDAKHAA